jgi:DNA polymerase-3 subunit alpha
LLIFANQYEELNPHLIDDAPVLIRGSVRADEASSPKVSVSAIVSLDNVRVELPSQISITVKLGNGSGRGEDVASQLGRLIESKPGDTDIRLRILRSKDYLVFYDLAARVRADREFRDAAEEICGKGSLEITAAG